MSKEKDRLEIKRRSVVFQMFFHPMYDAGLNRVSGWTGRPTPSTLLKITVNKISTIHFLGVCVPLFDET